MAMHKLGIIGGFFIAVLISGLCGGFARKPLNEPFAVIHKLLAVLCLVLLLRAFWGFKSLPALPAAIFVFASAYLAAFVTGIVQSIPASASSIWLGLHRVAAAIAVIACAVAARLIASAARL